MEIAPASSTAAPHYFSSLKTPGCVTFVWGDSRAALGRVLYAMARDVDPEFFWLDIRSPSDVVLEPGPIELDLIPNHRLYVTAQPSDVHPQDPIANLALSVVVRLDSPEAELGLLVDLIRLPQLTQKIMGDLDRPGGPHVLVFGNAERVREFYPRTAEEVRPFLDAEIRAGVIPFYGLWGPAGPARMVADFVFEVRVRDLLHWRDGALLCEKAPTGSAFHAGQAIPLTSVECLAEVFALNDPNASR